MKIIIIYVHKWKRKLCYEYTLYMIKIQKRNILGDVQERNTLKLKRWYIYIYIYVCVCVCVCGLIFHKGGLVICSKLVNVRDVIVKRCLFFFFKSLGFLDHIIFLENLLFFIVRSWGFYEGYGALGINYKFCNLIIG